jgi:hypothetical protein
MKAVAVNPSAADLAVANPVRHRAGQLHWELR